MPEERNYRIDNIRAVLIILVLIGHLTEVIPYQNSDFIYHLIYIFHMPGFAVLSGLCWSVLKREQIWKKLVYPYVIFQTLYVMFSRFVLKDEIPLQYTTPYWLMWYLFALIQWEMIASVIPFTKKNTGKIILCALIVALMCGFDNDIGYFLSLSRMLVLFPFFIAGVCLREFPKVLSAKPKQWMIVAAVVCLTICIMLVWHSYKKIQNIWLYHSFSYQTAEYTMGVRGGILILAVVILVSLLVLIPNVRVRWMSYLGQNTMPIFLLHGFIVRWMGLYRSLWNRPHYKLVILLMIVILMLLILSSRFVVALMKPLMSWPLKQRS